MGLPADRRGVAPDLRLELVKVYRFILYRVVNIVVSTTDGAVQRHVRSFKKTADVLMVDEACATTVGDILSVYGPDVPGNLIDMADIDYDGPFAARPKITAPGPAKYMKNLILVGDPKQLPPR